jgi:hypothetical protein
MKRSIMNTVRAVSVAMLVLAIPVQALACKSAGAFKHVGVVTTVDTTALTVTINDAESGEPITFAATAEQLKNIKPGDQVMIAFLEEKNGILTAVKIHS